MILFFELTWTGVRHAPINSAMLQIVSAAWPGHPIRLYADSTHIEQLRCDRRFTACTAVESVAVHLSDGHSGRTQIVSPARFWNEFATIHEALRSLPTGETCLIVLLSATSTAIWAAALAARLRVTLGGAKIAGVQVLLHGNLNDAVGWRTRNPLLRRFDLAATLRSSLPVPVRYVVFEQNIIDQLLRIAPRAAALTDVLPHPVSLGDLAEHGDHPPMLDFPIHVGFVGQGTLSKGFDTFLDLATQLSKRHPGRLVFHMVGTVPSQLLDAARLAPLAEQPETEPLSREEFTARLGRLHFVVLPFRQGYYDLSASGGLIDAVTRLRPVLATDVPLVRGVAAAHGDIGHICDDLAAVLDGIVTAPDAARYAAQVEAMRRARALRTPEALASVYRAAVLTGFPMFSGD